MGRIGELIPHRRAMNRSLRRDSELVRERYERRIAEEKRLRLGLQRELRAAGERKEKELTLLANELDQMLAEHEKGLKSVSDEIRRYVKDSLRIAEIRETRSLKERHARRTSETIDFLNRAMRLMGKEIEELEVTVEHLRSISDVSDTARLLATCGATFVGKEPIDAHGLLDRVNARANSGSDSYGQDERAVKRLRVLLDERSDYASACEYISWAIVQEKRQSAYLKSEMHAAKHELKILRGEVAASRREESAIESELSDCARRLQLHWQKPAALLSADICYCTKRASGAGGEAAARLRRERSEKVASRRRLWQSARAVEELCERGGAPISILSEIPTPAQSAAFAQIIASRLAEVRQERSENLRLAEEKVAKELERIESEETKALGEIDQAIEEKQAEIETLKSKKDGLERKRQAAESRFTELSAYYESSVLLRLLCFFGTPHDLSDAMKGLEVANDVIERNSQSISNAECELEKLSQKREIQQEEYESRRSRCTVRKHMPASEEDLENEEARLTCWQTANL